MRVLPRSIIRPQCYEWCAKALRREVQVLLLPSKAQCHLARRRINGRDHEILNVLCDLWVFLKVNLVDKVHPEAAIAQRKSVAMACGGQIEVDNVEDCVVGQDVFILRVIGEDATSTTVGGVSRSIPFDNIR